MKTKIFATLVLVFLSFINSALAQSSVDVSAIKNFAVSIHIIELLLALFIGYMSLKFFRITKPINLFLLVYVAIGFFIINTLLYLFSYLSINTRLEMNFISVYLGSRVTLIGMLLSFAIFFYQGNRIMRKTKKD